MSEARVPLALKYRPGRFGAMKGQTPAVAVLYQMCRGGKLPGALLFYGESGCGKTTMARMVAKALNCEAGPGKAGAWPCGTCPECKAADNDSSAHVEELDAASNGTVDKIRELRDRAAYGAQPGHVKVYIVDEAHGLSGAACQAMLKTLEEPLPGVLFIFCTTEPGKLPETILNRLSPFLFVKMSPRDITARLQWICQQEDFAAEPAMLSAIAEAARGSMRGAVVRLDQMMCVGITSYSMWQKFTGESDYAPAMLNAAADGDLDALYQLKDEAVAATGDPGRVASAVIGCLTDVLRLSCNGPVDAQGEALAARQQLAGRLTRERAQGAMAVLWDLYARVRGVSADDGLKLALSVISRRLCAKPPEAAPAISQAATAAEISSIMEGV
jgi:DNA polymerase-3 subunit gamma/tau